MTTAPHDDQEAEDTSTPALGTGPDSDTGPACLSGLAWAPQVDLGELIWALTDGNPASDLANGPADLAEADQDALQDQDAVQDQDAILDQDAAAREQGRMRTVRAGEVAGRAAERLTPGPGLAVLLDAVPVTGLGDRDLPAVAAGFRRLASWATAAELSAVAEIAARTAARDPKAGVAEDGRPAQITVSAAAQVALAECMSQFGASCWADLAVTLTWRLPGTGAALAAGRIDLSRARLIAEATGVLGDEAARAVEDRVLPAAGDQTLGQLRAVLRQAVITADPEGAERRRQEAERAARVRLYPDDDGTATLTGQGLPAVPAAAALARIAAIARAWKAAGAGGGSDLLQAQVFIGLLCGTLPYIPPAQGAPPDPAPPDDPPSDDPPSDDRVSGPGALTAASPPWDDSPVPRDQDVPADPDPDTDPRPGGDAGQHYADPADEDPLVCGPAPAWPGLPALSPPPPAAQVGASRPVRGLLDLTLPWQTLATGAASQPGHLGRIGPITAAQARHLADHAARDPAATWRIIVTDPAGRALAVTRIPRPHTRDGPTRDSPTRDSAARDSAARDGPARAAPGTGLTGRVTLTIAASALTSPAGPDLPDGLAAAALRAAARAAARASAQATADDAAGGGCAHRDQTSAYRPPPRILDYVIARDQTCRFPSCRQPAWRADLDHTIAYHHGGRTCRCNLGGLCRTHHQLKQLHGWTLRQIRPGTFTWTTPAGRSYLVTPDIHSS